MHTSAEKTQDPASHSLVLGTGQNNFGSLFKPDSPVPKGEKPRVSQFCRLWGWSDGMPLPSLLPYAVPSSGSADLGCSLRIRDTVESPVPTRAFLDRCNKPFSAFRGRMDLQKFQKGLWLRQVLQQIYRHPKSA